MDMLFMDILLQSLMPLLPSVIVVITVLVLMVAISLKRSYQLTAIIAISGLNCALIVAIWQFIRFDDVVMVGTLFKIDGFGLFNQIVVLMASLACATLSLGYFDPKNNQPTPKDIAITEKEELYVLMLISVAGAMMMTLASHFVSFFVSLELLSVPMYGMLAYQFFRVRSLEAGIKYLVLSASASATLLMGMALIFADTGSMHFASLGLVLSQQGSSVLVLGAVLMMVAVAFKLSLAPFQAWAGDVYQGAPVAVSAFLASVGKVAVMALAIRFLIESAMPILPAVDFMLMVMIALSVVFGNLLALYQTSLKRMLAFSSVSHMGYALMILLATGAVADTVVSLYMAVYALSAVGAFGVIVLMSRLTHSDDNNEADDFLVYRGLFWRRPVLTAVMTLMLLSMAGIPLTAGFMTKMQALFATVQGGRFGLSALLILGSAIGLYYYLKVILMMYKRPDVVIRYDVDNAWAGKLGGLMVILVAIGLFVFGTFLPQTMIYLSSLATIG